jgi:hypothetical protein
MTPLLPVEDLARFAATREALHQVAEHVLAKARFDDDGEIRLTAWPGGFATPALSGGRRVRVEGVSVVVHDHAGQRVAPLRSVAAAARFVGIEPGFPRQLYPPATALEPDRPLDLDSSSASALAAWYGFTAAVLERYRAELGRTADPSPLILWPEHFDQAFFTQDTDEARRANYGASPGDAGHPEPYLYVGPWAVPATDPYWNASHFPGAVLPLSALLGRPDAEAEALAFLAGGRSRLLAAPAA